MSLTNKWYHILKILLVKKSVEADSLCRLTRMSALTLRKNIALLNDQLDKIATIHSDHHNYQIEIFHMSAFKEIMNGRLKMQTDFNSSGRRVAYLLKRLIETNEFVIIDDLAEEMGVSRGTVNKDLKQAKVLLSEYGIEMQGVPNKGLQIAAAEYLLRLVYINEIMDYFTQSDLPPELTKMIQRLTTQYNLDFMAVNTLEKNIQFSLQRILAGHTIQTEIPYYNNFEKDSAIVEELIFQIESSYQLTLSGYEQGFLIFPLNTRTTIPISQLHLEAHTARVKQLFVKMVAAIHENFVISFAEEQLFEDLKYHLMFLLNRMIFYQSVFDLFLNEVQIKYPFSYELAKLAAEVIEKELALKLPEVEISYLAIYFELAQATESRALQKRVVVVCSTGKGTAALIQRQLSSVLGPDVQIDLMSEVAYNQADLTGYSAIFSTLPLGKRANLPVVQITHIFDQQALLKELQDLERQRLSMTKDVIIRHVLLDPTLSYRENVENIIRTLIKQGDLAKSFLELWRERENKSSTIFDSGIGFPHTMNDQPGPIVLTIGTTEDVIHEADQDVHLVFLLGIPATASEATNELLTEIFDLIFVIAQNSLIRQRITQVRDEDELKKVLEKARFI